MELVKKYKKKPVVISALRFDGENVDDILEWTDGASLYEANTDELFIVTLEGDMLVGPGDFVIRGVAGEFYPCKNDIFEKTYEAV